MIKSAAVRKVLLVLVLSLLLTPWDSAAGLMPGGFQSFERLLRSGLELRSKPLER
jgi:hypothetical protein